MLKQSLLKKLSLQEISHFYIVSCPLNEHDARDYLNEWINDFLCEVLCSKRDGLGHEKAQESLKLGHSDIQFIETDNKLYTDKNEDFKEFYKFLEYSASELGHKFIIVKDIHKISESIGNKLLKTLEEPPFGVTIFFLDPQKKKVLTTISSRAIRLNLPIHAKTEEKSFNASLSFEQWVNTQANLELNKSAQSIIGIESGNGQIHSLIEEIRSKNIDEEEIIKLLMNWITNTSQDGEKVMNFIEQIKTIDYQRPFNGPAQGRMVPLLSKLFTL